MMAASEKKTILVIDDQYEVRELVEGALRDAEFTIVKAAGGREGIQKAKTECPDLILLDIMMPEFDGISTCKILQRNAITKNIPVIFLTAKQSGEDVKAAIQAGGKDYIAKPFSPADLLARVRTMITKFEHTFDPATVVRKEELEAVQSQEETRERQARARPQLDIQQHGNVMLLSTTFDGIVQENFDTHRDIFQQIMSEGNYQVAFDIDHVRRMDGTGLGLLVSVNDALRQQGGGLRITYPTKELNAQFSFANLNDLFRAYKDVHDAADSFHEKQTDSRSGRDGDTLNVCLVCTFVNPKKFRYCGYCGANLMIWKGERILESLRHAISRKVFSDAQTGDIAELNRRRNIHVEDENVPSVFAIEITGDNLALSYTSRHTDDAAFPALEQIAVQAPKFNDRVLPLAPGMKVVLRNTNVGKRSKFETRILQVDDDNGMIVVQYSEEAKNLHTQKHFSITPKRPVPVRLMNPSVSSAGTVIKGAIFELTRLGMVVFSEDAIPVNQCLSAIFTLPGGGDVSTPLAIARQADGDFMYDVEFVVIDEKERTEIVQYMYKRQIEQSKEKSEI